MVQVTQEQGVTVLVADSSYTGMDYRALEEFGEILLSEASQTTPPRFVVDLSQTDFIGSSFIELLVRAWKRIKNRNGTMALCAVHPFCREILRVSHLDTIWPIYNTRSEAVSSV
jgi:anti-anti-sigma factor